ncbi:methyl-accepting chemotaxis protein [Thermanaerovibrio velox DSM 12556]|uniref:Methyl-accepting chemotaxis protein n=1 Tax=Thermanaerovibrio velox DSM 12556 TaxID=926567 RepID=H0UP53_9BACT|nr:methyl-accepting chemotaxis protein [Thermanaerovibrio velox]EHM09466.1 methyl-accepting chemotaxis protein [Thermanaerovibrio velox DSM 12556]
MDGYLLKMRGVLRMERVLRGFSIRARLWFLLIGLVIAMGGVSAFLLSRLDMAKGEADKMYSFGASGMRWAMSAMASGEMSVINSYRSLNSRTPEDREKWAKESVTSIEEALEYLDRYKATLRAGDLGSLKAYEEARAALEAMREVNIRVEEMTSSGASEEEIKAFLGASREKTQRAIGALEELVGVSQRVMSSSKEGLDRSVGNAKRVAVSISLLVALLALLVGIGVTLSISRPLTAMVKKIEDMATNLDLRFGDPGSYGDEIGILGVSLAKMFRHFEEIIHQVRSISQSVSDQAETFSATAEEANASVQEVRSQLELTVSRIDDLASGSEEVSASVGEVASASSTAAQRSTEVAEQVVKAKEQQDAGMAFVRQAVESIGSVAEKARSSMEMVEKLHERANTIQAIVAQIGGIADQTNLLALNAAIEAARAGEHGRGFAVVAEEVRKLAEESAHAAKSISDIAEAISQDLNVVVESVEDNAKGADQVRELSQKVLEVFERISESLSGISMAAQDMAATAEEEAASAEEIASVIQGMADKTRDVHDATSVVASQIRDVSQVAEQVAQGATELAAIAEKLDREISRFKVSGKEGAGRLSPSYSPYPALDASAS